LGERRVGKYLYGNIAEWDVRENKSGSFSLCEITKKASEGGHQRKKKKEHVERHGKMKPRGGVRP